MIDGTLLKIKALYFWINVLVCALHTFKAQYLMEELGLRKSQVGYVYVMQAVMLVGSMTWSALADRRPTLNRPLSAALALLYAAITCLLLLKIQFGYVLAIVLASYFMSSALFPLLDAQVMHFLGRHKSGGTKSASRDADPAGSIAGDPSARVSDGSTSHLDPHGHRGDADPTPPPADTNDASGLSGKMLFSRQRMWGAVGVTTASWLSLLVNSYVHHISGMFAVMVLAACVYAVLALLFMSPHPTSARSSPNAAGCAEGPGATNANTPHKSGWAQSPVIRLFRIPLWSSFMLFVLSAGVTRAVLTLYLNLFLIKEIGLANASPPYAATIRLLSEWSVFFAGHWFTLRFGHHGVLLISQGAGLVRILGYGYLDAHSRQWPQIAFYLLIGLLELLKGANSGLIVVGATKLASEMAPPGCEHTAQGMLTGVFIGLASALTGLCSGLFLDYHAGSTIGQLFRWSGWVGVAAYAVFVAHFYVSGVLKAPRPTATEGVLAGSPDGSQAPPPSPSSSSLLPDPLGQRPK